jgi:ubiquinone/menaquinone biosynthesis C-methylase UbiE
MQQTQTTQPVFDPVKYKQMTLEQWNSAAEAWHRWGSLLSRWLGPATETMLDMASVSQGSCVLDVVAGAGEQTLTAARCVGATGQVLATDIAPVILESATARASARISPSRDLANGNALRLRRVKRASVARGSTG